MVNMLFVATSRASRSRLKDIVARRDSSAPAQFNDIRLGSTVPTDHAVVHLCLLEMSPAKGVDHHVVLSRNLLRVVGYHCVQQRSDCFTVYGNEKVVAQLETACGPCVWCGRVTFFRGPIRPFLVPLCE